MFEFINLVGVEEMRRSSLHQPSSRCVFPASRACALADRTEGSFPEHELLSIRKTALRGGEIVRQLMTYSGEQNPVFELADVSSLVDEMPHLLKVSISKHVSLEADLGEAISAVRANPAQLQQVVMNLRHQRIRGNLIRSSPYPPQPLSDFRAWHQLDRCILGS